MNGTLAVLAKESGSDTGTRLVLSWLSGMRSEHTQMAYARDIGIPVPRRTGRPRSSRAPAWLAWCQAAGLATPLDASEDHLTLYARALDAAGLSAATCARKLSAIASWYAWLARRGHIVIPIGKEVARPSVSPDVSVTPGLTHGQALAMITTADAMNTPQGARTSALIAVLILTGARVSEVTGADIEDLGTDRGHRVLWVTRKGGVRQALALVGPAAGRVDAYLAARTDLAAVPALPGRAGARPRRVLFATAPRGARMFPADIWHLVRRIAAEADLPPDLVARLGPHAMRHAFATLSLDAGASLRDLQDALGHADPRTTRRYDRSRHSLDRAPGYKLAAFLAVPELDAG